MTPHTGHIAASPLARALLALDAAALLAALALAAPRGGAFDALAAGALASALLATWVVVAASLRHYDLAEHRPLFDDLALVSVLVMAATTVVALASALAPRQALPHAGWFALALWPAALALRLLARAAGPARDEAEDGVLVVGTGPLALATAEELAHAGRALLGFVHLEEEPAPGPLPAPVLGESPHLGALLAARAVGEVYLAAHASRSAQAMQQAIDACETLGVPFALPAHDFRLHRAQPAEQHALADGYLHLVEVEPKPVQLALKRLFDIASSALALWVLSPLLLGVAAAIRLTSTGPVLYRQERVGLHGRHFHMLKFRSMVVGADALKATLAAQNEQTGPVFKMQKDPRVTRVGRLLRKFSIDELPQLVNVLRGDMSIVGPRPPVPAEVAQYQPWQLRRLSIRPGLTCIWQVSGRDKIGFERWMYLDMQYIDHWSLGTDLRLILKTVPVVLTGSGAS